MAIANLPMESLKHLLASSKDSVAAYDIPISSALWDSENATLIMDMTTSLKHQGHEGICFGGFISAVLDLTSGLAGFIKAAENGQIVLGKHSEIDFLRPLPVGISIQVVAKIEEIQIGKIISSANIIKKSDNKNVASCVLEMKVDDVVRLNGKSK